MWCNTGEEGIVGNIFILVCNLNGKWLKNPHVFCVNLFYYDMRKVV